MWKGHTMRILKEEIFPLGEPLSAEAALDAFNKLSEGANDFVDAGWSAEEVFWSRYFWICTYANFVRSTAGPDADLERFIRGLLERPSPFCEPDWAWVDIVVDMARRETERWVGEPLAWPGERLPVGAIGN